MPNWVYNRLDVESENLEQLKAFKEKAKTKESELSFGAFFPLPEELKNVQSPVRIVTEEEYPVEKEKAEKAHAPFGSIYLPITAKMSKKFKKKYGADNWYDWQIENWGCKWDCNEAELINENIRDEKDWKYGTLEYKFETPWSPPVLFLEKVSKLYPELHFSMKYEEECEGFFGRAKGQNGEIDNQSCD